MRYLWVEDFNDGSETSETLEMRLRDIFFEKDDKIEIKKTLLDAVEFLEERQNLHEIDAILLDIRFPSGDKTDLDKYFANIVTDDFYKQNIDDAAGVLLYILLIFKYRIPRTKIAFISANIENDDDLIMEMIKIIDKSKIEKLSDDDMFQYRTLEIKLGKKRGYSRRDGNVPWKEFISKDNTIQNIDSDELKDALKSEREEDKTNETNETNKTNLKFNIVKETFGKIGLEMSSAFIKPKQGITKGDDQGNLFKEWSKIIESEPYNSIRSSVLEMCIILIKYFNREDFKDEFYSDFLKLLTCDDNEKGHYNKDFFVRYLKDLEGIFLIECEEDMEIFCRRALKDISALWEATALPKYSGQANTSQRGRSMDCSEKPPRFCRNDKCYYACHATMKLMRNWMGHQGIKDVTIEDVGIMFVVCMRGLFKIDLLSDEEDNKLLTKYIQCEDKILGCLGNEKNVWSDIQNSKKYFYDLNNKVLNSKNSQNSNYKPKCDIDDFRSWISGLGNAKSEIRREVSMDEIYMLLYHALENNPDPNDIISQKILDGIKTRTWKDWDKRYNGRFQERFNVTAK